MQKSKISRANCPCPSCIMFKKLIKSILIGGRRGYAERPSSKKVAALKRNQGKFLRGIRSFYFILCFRDERSPIS